MNDNPINQKVIGYFLNKLALPAVCVGNGLEAVLVMEQGMTPKAILMDVQMPEMNGLDAARKIREWETSHGQPTTVIVGLTAGASDGDKGKCLNRGMDDVLFKPVDLDELESKIMSLVSPEPSVDEALP